MTRSARAMASANGSVSTAHARTRSKFGSTCVHGQLDPVWNVFHPESHARLSDDRLGEPAGAVRGGRADARAGADAVPGGRVRAVPLRPHHAADAAGGR